MGCVLSSLACAIIVDFRVYHPSSPLLRIKGSSLNWINLVLWNTHEQVLFFHPSEDIQMPVLFCRTALGITDVCSIMCPFSSLLTNEHHIHPEAFSKID